MYPILTRPNQPNIELTFELFLVDPYQFKPSSKTKP